MKPYLSIFVNLSLSFGMIFSTSCAHSPSPEEAKEIPAGALKGGQRVYSAFVDFLGKGPRDNEFTRFGSNADNYTVSITDQDDKFVYTFVLNPYRDQPVLDGMVSFSLSKGDGNVERVRRP